MVKTMEETWPKSVIWSKPEGGLFIWVTLPEGVKAKELLNKCIEKGVIFIAGLAFYPNAEVDNTFRMSFASMTDELIVEGISRVGEAMNEFIK